MGYYGRRLSMLNPRPLLAELTRAYADEWFAHYNYQHVANTLRGYRAPSLTELLRRKSAEAFERTNRIAERILELGGEPLSSLTMLDDHATGKPFKIPHSMADVEGVLKAVLDAERTSLHTYDSLLRMTRGKDPLTEALMQEYLGAAVKGEEELERLLGQAAPAMNGGQK
jgi:bacterioferritin